NDGIFRFDQESYAHQKFDRNDGFMTSEFNGGTAQALTSGEVLLGSIKGVFLFEPSAMKTETINTLSPKITGVTLLSSKIQKRYSDFNDHTIIMEHDDFGLTVEFSSLLLDRPEQVKFNYWMDGDSVLSKTLVNRSELFFPSFTAGQRKLFISARDYRNGKDSEPISITIINKPSPFLSNTAKLIYVFLILSIGLTFFWLYQRRQQLKELAFQEIKQSEERLNLALQGGNSGLWDWYADNNQVYEPRLAKLSSENSNGFVPFRSRISAIFTEDQREVLDKWHDFRHGKIDVFDCIYRMQTENQKWEWFRDIAMVSEFDSNNKPIRVTGTYTNINEKQKASEQIKLFSKAFENSLDIIIILNDKHEIIATNHAFQNITKYSQNEITGVNISSLLTSVDNFEIYSEIFSSIVKNKQWKGEAKLVTKNSVKISTLVSATIFSSSNTSQYYVFSISDISKQKQAERNLKKLANYDQLTELPNRSLLLDRIAHAIVISKRDNKQLAIFFIDLDRFKQVNDSLGHDTGDKVLTRAAQILKNCCRAEDTVARLGGDEFVVMLENIESVSNINRILQNILEEIKIAFFVENNQVSISASIGVSIYPQDAKTPSDLLKHADIAMYHAKNTGRNNFRYFKEHMNKDAEQRLNLETKLRMAVEQNELHLEYQPQFELTSGKLCGVEALARWTTECGEIIPPSTFIPVAEELGLIIPITENLLPQAIKQVTAWNTQDNALTLAFNLSAVHIYDDSFIPFIEQQINHFPNVAKILEFELTESILMADIDKALKTFQILEKYEIDLALDDFGTGYSSLKYLNSLPINKLKIDMSFVKQIGLSPENDVIIHAIISLAKSLNLSVVAEGIETDLQFKFLKNECVNYAQGYLFSKPVAANKINNLLNKNLYDQ
ncbi:MAG: EAL domain-containing protein, partial [Kangiellaceae bacterium]